ATIAVLGAGGAARAVAVGAADAGAARVVVLNRTEARARSVAEALERACPTTRIEAAPLGGFADVARRADVVVMTVSREGLSAIRALDPSFVRADATWIDLNYWDPDPPHLAGLQRRGVRVQDGLPMLIHQGALAFRAFTGAPAAPEVARRVLTGRIGS
ncbi:MAG: NAD(P)-binding domain-containing protein, partial [Phycisphaerales bacterium]|nr:NAD(P)-binding domain-containing protein [Phycisphaerales bacterium]